jgi:hypothetical protein
LSEFFIVLAAVWGSSGAAVVIIFALDERSYRGVGLTKPLDDVPIHPTAPRGAFEGGPP